MGDRKHSFSSFIKGSTLSKPKSAAMKAKPVKPLSRRATSPSKIRPKQSEEKHLEPKEIFMNESEEFQKNTFSAWNADSELDFKKDLPQTNTKNKPKSSPIINSPSIPYEPPSESDLIGTLLVIVHEAKDLQETDIGLIQNLYVVVKLGTEEYKSRIARKTIQPIWNQRFKMYLYKNSPTTLDFIVCDENEGEIIGQVSIPVSVAMLSGKPIDEWYMLRQGIGKQDISKGTIRVSLQFKSKLRVEEKTLPLPQIITPIATSVQLENSPTKTFISSNLKEEESSQITKPTVPYLGTLIVEVKEARGLRAADRNGSSDPYCLLRLGRIELRTRTVKRELNPMFNEQFKFFVGPHSASNLEIFIFDEDIQKQDDLLGYISIPLSHILDQPKIFEDWLNLGALGSEQFPSMRGATGSLHIKLDYRTDIESISSLSLRNSGPQIPTIPIQRDVSDSSTNPEFTFSSKSFPPVPAQPSLQTPTAQNTLEMSGLNNSSSSNSFPQPTIHVTPPRLEDPNVPPPTLSPLLPNNERIKVKQRDRIGKLLLTVIEARGIRVGDKTGASDPFCILKFGEDVQETNVIRNTVNPKWREQFKFIVDVAHPPFLHIQIFDKDQSKADDFLGSVKISINSLRRHTGGVIDTWFDLESDTAFKDTLVTGSLHLRIEYIPDEHLASQQLRFSTAWSNNPTTKAQVDQENENKYETPREYIDRRIPKTRNIDELIEALGEGGFSRAAEIPLTLDFSFRTAFLLCEEATIEFLSCVLHEVIEEVEVIEQATEEYDSVPLMLRAVARNGKSHVIVLNLKPSADENFLWRSIYNTSYSLQYILSTSHDFNRMGKVVMINVVSRTASELFVSLHERNRKTQEEDFHIKLQLRSTLTPGRASFMPELDFLEIHYFLLDRFPDSYESAVSLPSAEYIDDKVDPRNTELSRRDAHLLLMQWLHFIKSNTKYKNISVWPTQLLENVNILKMAQILSVLATDEEFIYKLGQHEMESTAQTRAFMQIEDLKRELRAKEQEFARFRH